MPPPPLPGRNAHGKPPFLPPPPTVLTSAHDRPTLRFPAVPPPLSPVQSAVPTPVIDVNEPTLEEKPVRAAQGRELDERSPDERARNGTFIGLAPRAAAGIEPLRPRKKGAPAPHHGEAHHQIPPIDPAAWLADEAHARSSDRRDSADGVDPSDTIVPVPKPHHTSV